MALVRGMLLDYVVNVVDLSTPSPNALHATQVQELRDKAAQGFMRAVVDISLQQLGTFGFWHDIVVGYRRRYEA